MVTDKKSGVPPWASPLDIFPMPKILQTLKDLNALGDDTSTDT